MQAEPDEAWFGAPWDGDLSYERPCFIVDRYPSKICSTFF